MPRKLAFQKVAFCLPSAFRLLVYAGGRGGLEWCGAGMLGFDLWGASKCNRQGDVHFQTHQDSLGELAFAASEAKPDFTPGLRVLSTALLAPQRASGWASEAR